MNETLIQVISGAIQARQSCKRSNNTGWFDNWTERLSQLEQMLPSGSGIDSGTKIDVDASHAERIVLYTSFHHMNDVGYYDGWTEHTVIVTPGFRSLNLRISGRNRNEIKDHLYETFDYTLTRPVVWDKEAERYRWYGEHTGEEAQ